MLTASADFKDALNNSYLLKPNAKLTAEWNHNRFGGIQQVDNTPSDETSNDNIAEFPVSSIVEPHRPISGGVVKARAMGGGFWPTTELKPGFQYWRRNTSPEGDGSFTTEDYSDTPDEHRYYTVSADSPYKYWASPGVSNSSGTGGYAFSSGEEVAPFVIYKVASLTNKIVIGLENTWASPVDYDIQITEDGTSWTTISSDNVPDENGRVILYRQSNNSWDSETYLENALRIKGLRLIVSKIDKPQSRFNLIEISARLEADLTPWLETWDNEMTIAEKNFLTPLGKASANNASISLFNDGLFSNENINSPYYHIIDENVKMTLDLIYNTPQPERIRQFTMWVDTWGPQESLEGEVRLRDSAKFMQDQPLPVMLLENITIGEAVWRICDSIGLTNYNYTISGNASSTFLPYFWTEPDTTVWDSLTKLAEATQTAIYFDEYDVLQIKTRDSAFDKDADVAWHFEATNGNGKLADVISSEDDFNFESNTVNINYKNTHISDDNKDSPEMEVVWQPDGDYVLRATSLRKTLTSTDTIMYITGAAALTWPYEATVNIEGELIRYSKKQYVYATKDAGGNKGISTAWIISEEEKANIDKNLSDPDNAYKNWFSGALQIIERGYLWSYPRDHYVDINGYQTHRSDNGIPSYTTATGVFTLNAALGSAKMTTTPKYLPSTYALIERGSTADTAPRSFGTRFKIDSAATGTGIGAAGIHFMANNGGLGYYAEFVRTEILAYNGGVRRTVQNEINFYVKKGTGLIKRLPGFGLSFNSADGTYINYAGPVQGNVVTVADDVWTDLDVEFTVGTDGYHQISIWLNGLVVYRTRVAPADQVPSSGKYGLFQRGSQVTDFEYFYAIDNGVFGPGLDAPDDISSWDYIHGGYRSNQFVEEYTYSTKVAERRVGKKNVVYRTNYNKYFFDEFAPIVHEVREVTVKFDKVPCVHSRIFTSNDSESVIVDYTPTPFGAKFMIANSARINAILNGDDTLTSPGNTLNQRFFIYGRLVIQDPQETIVTNGVSTVTNQIIVENDDRIRRSGVKVVSIESPWIQNKEEAQSLSDWITQHWADGANNINIETFGNPLVTIGDLVTVDFPLKFLSGTTHKYFVTGVTRSWDNGLDTKFTLRRTS